MKKKQEIIGIIGGKGKTGSWFKNFFRKEGYPVLISDINTDFSNKDLIKKSDIVVFSLPIDKTINIINSLTQYSRKNQLWMDLTSIKTPAIEAMLNSKAEVIGLHPMFAPTISSLKSQTIIICEARAKIWKGWIDNLVTKNYGKVKYSTPEEHDKMMAIIQGLIHFNTIILGNTFRKLGLDIEESLEYTSPIYKISMDMIGRILSQDPNLYANIEIQNPFIKDVLNNHLQSAEKLKEIIEKKDTSSFKEYFKKASLHLGKFKKESYQESKYLIEKLVEKNKNLSKDPQ